MGLRNSDNCVRSFWVETECLQTSLLQRSVILAPAEGSSSFYYTMKEGNFVQSQKTIFINKIIEV